MDFYSSTNKWWICTPINWLAMLCWLYFSFPHSLVLCLSSLFSLSLSLSFFHSLSFSQSLFLSLSPPPLSLSQPASLSHAICFSLSALLYSCCTSRDLLGSYELTQFATIDKSLCHATLNYNNFYQLNSFSLGQFNHNQILKRLTCGRRRQKRAYIAKRK